MTDLAPEDAPAMRDADDTEDMAAVGRSLMDSIGTLVKSDPRFKHWAPAQDPAEIVFDIVNMLDESNDYVLRLQAAILLVRGIIKDGAMVGFKPLDGDWAERLFASQGTTKNALTPVGSSAPISAGSMNPFSSNPLPQDAGRETREALRRMLEVFDQGHDSHGGAEHDTCKFAREVLSRHRPAPNKGEG